MLGLAQKLFKEKNGQVKQPVKQWPLLDQFMIKEALSHVDYALADHLLRRVDCLDEAVAALICHMSLAMREGHLCVKVENGQVLPDPEVLWNKESLLTEKELSQLNTLILLGAQRVPDQLMSAIEVESHAFVGKPLCRFHNLFYFQRYWLAESHAIHHFARIAETTPSLKWNVEQMNRSVADLTHTKKLLPEQAEAVMCSLDRCLTIVCGGPGTGKTYTAGQMIRLFWDAMTPGQKGTCSIALAAPTGKAAANLQQSLGNAFKDLFGFKALTAKTLHALLGLNGKGKRKEGVSKLLTADIILVDECSMIDVQLMGKLLESVKLGARLILLGDPYQLPPVEMGSFFADMIKDTKGSPAFLKTCLRAELKELADFAEAINTGNQEKAFEILSQGSGVSRLPWMTVGSDTTGVFDKMLKHVTPFFPVLFNPAFSMKQQLEQFNRFRVLSPLKKGQMGVDRLNQEFFRHFAAAHIKHHDVVVPIMLTSSDGRLEMFNGEVGVLVLRAGNREGSFVYPREGDYAIFSSKDGSCRTMPALLLPKYEYAYCMTVHKSQGSEFEQVLLLMPEGSQCFGREVLYTAVTRARKKLEICSSDAILNKTIAFRKERLSRI